MQMVCCSTHKAQKMHEHAVQTPLLNWASAECSRGPEQWREKVHVKKKKRRSGGITVKEQKRERKRG